MLAITNPTFLAGKLAYLEGIPSEAIEHCSSEVAAVWLDGWNEARTELMQLRSQIAGDRRGISVQHRTDLL